MDVASLITGYSKALYSNWILYKPDHLLIDCGEGAATTLGNGGYLIERVLITHGHIDHISGLPTLLWSRAAGMGDNEKPLEIYYPRDDIYVGDMRAYLKRAQARLPYQLNWIPLGPDDCFPLIHGPHPEATETQRAARCVETFPTRHIHGQQTLGYKIVETRRRRRPQYADLSEEEIRRQVKEQGPAFSNELMEEYRATLVAFGGDCVPLDPAALQGTELLVHEATILDAADRKQQLHSTVDEAIEVAAAVRPKALLLNHVSGRYRGEEVKRAIGQSGINHQIDFPVWCLFREKLCKAFGPVGSEGDQA